MTMLEMLPRWMRGSTAEELDVNGIPPVEETNRIQDCALLAMAVAAIVASLCL